LSVISQNKDWLFTDNCGLTAAKKRPGWQSPVGASLYSITRTTGYCRQSLLCFFDFFRLFRCALMIFSSLLLGNKKVTTWVTFAFSLARPVRRAASEATPSGRGLLLRLLALAELCCKHETSPRMRKI
jgi:hypothetical protein